VVYVTKCDPVFARFEARGYSLNFLCKLNTKCMVYTLSTAIVRDDQEGASFSEETM
jgi:hypothetical protein